MDGSHSSPVAAESIHRRANTRIPGKQTMKWDAKADQQLLLAILAAHEVKIDFEAVASRLGEHCTPRAVVERLKKLKKQAAAQDYSASSSAPMPKAPPVKKRKVVVPGEDAATDNQSAAHVVEKLTQARVIATGTVSAGSGFREVGSTGESPSRSISTSNNVEKKGKSSGRGLLPVKQTKTLGISYTQSSLSSGQILLEERGQDSIHKLKVFSSQKMPQPFLDR